MRVAAGVSALYYGFFDPREGPRLVSLLLSAGETTGGAMLIAGFWTPAAGLLLSVFSLAGAVHFPGDTRARLLTAVLGVGLAMIGPGSWSIDARRFGRKRIDFPHP